MSTPIRKVVISAFGDESNVNVVQDKIQDPAPGFAQVKVIYSGFNGSDVNMRLGRYPLQKKAPLTPGYCLVGTIHALPASSSSSSSSNNNNNNNNNNNSALRKCDLVVAVTVYDAEAELCNVAEKHLHRVPQGMDAKQACGLVMDWNTAFGMVKHAANVTAGQRVFVHGMSGAVGYALMMLSKVMGAEVYGTASERNHDAIRKLGATPFVYSDKNWMREMEKLGGADVVYDPLGFESWDESFSILSQDGLLVGYGGNLASLNGDKDRSVILPTAKLLARGLLPCNKRRTKFYYITRDDKTFVSDLNTLFSLQQEGKIEVPVKKVWAMDEIQDAHRGWTSTAGMGSVFVQISEEFQS